MNDAKAASVHQRLLNRAKLNEEGFNLLLARYVGLRFLHRIAVSNPTSDFLLKGATLFLVWGGSTHRPTRDIDLLGFAAPDLANLAGVIRDICSQSVDPDGLTFDAESVETVAIREENAYGGVRCTVLAKLGSARQKLQIDVGYGDSISPEPETVEIPHLLDDEVPHQIKAYRFEPAVF